MSDNCQHENRYWINRARGNYRCLDCGYQYHNAPKKRQPTVDEQNAAFRRQMRNSGHGAYLR